MLRYGGHGRCAISEDPEQPELCDRQVVFSRDPSQDLLDGKAQLDQGVHHFRGPGSARFADHAVIVVDVLCVTKYMIGDAK